MIALLVADFQIVASPPPLDAMRQNPMPAGAKLREKMRQLVPKRAIEFDRMMNKLRIQGD
jgi:hypothetical protein